MKICVCIFAFVSGFGLMYGYMKMRGEGSPVSFVKKHLLSTCSGYWFLVPFAYLLYGLRHGFSYAKWGDTLWERAAGILADALGLSELVGAKSVNGAWWYMCAAITFIVLLPFLAEITLRWGGLAGVGLVFLLPRILGIEFQGGRAPLSFLMAMVFGMLCCRYNVFSRFHEWKPLGNGALGGIWKFTGTALLAAFGYVSYRRIPFTFCWEYNFAVIPFFFILFCVEYVFRWKLLKRFLGFLGRHSLNIWLVHTFVRDYLSTYVWSVRYFLLVPCVILGISLLVSLLVNFLKKYSGYDAWIKRRIRECG